MTRDEVRKILTILKVNYPQSFKGWNKEQSEMFLDLWCEAFKDESVQVVVSAVKSIIYGDTREFAPNIGQVKNKIYNMTHQGILDEDAAWDLVSKAIRHGIYHAKEEFDKLPPEVQAGVGSPNQIHDWAQLSIEETQTVIASNFKRSYRARAKSKREYDMLPTETKAMIEGLTKGMKMIE